MTHADKGAELVLGSRNNDYGNPHSDFSGVAMMWSGLINTKLIEPLTAVEVGLMMTALKLRRHAHKAKDDNLIDAHGYLTCVEWIEKGHRPAPAVEDARQTIEDVATGARLTCPKCSQSMPCLCGHQ